MIAIIFLLLSGIIMIFEKEVVVFDSPETTDEWRIINDVVMGGISKSNFTLNKNESAKFTGTLSPDNNGGFASVRTHVEENNLNDFDGVIIKSKGDGNLYNLRFRTDENYSGVSYQAKFKSNSKEWEEFKIPFKDFKPTFRGRLVPNQPELKSNNIRQIGILIADNQFGDFELNIKWIKFYKNSER